MCTTELWELLGGTEPLAERSTDSEHRTRLAVWSAKAVLVPSGIYCVAVNQETCMTLAFPLFTLPAFIAAFASAMAAELECIGIGDAVIARELGAFSDGIVFSKNSDRTLLGCLNGVSSRFESEMALEKPYGLHSLARVQHRLNRMRHLKRDVPIPTDAVVLLLGGDDTENRQAN